MVTGTSSRVLNVHIGTGSGYMKYIIYVIYSLETEANGFALYYITKFVWHKTQSGVISGGTSRMNIKWTYSTKVVYPSLICTVECSIRQLHSLSQETDQKSGTLGT